jgi:hypothetical protein
MGSGLAKLLDRAADHLAALGRSEVLSRLQPPLAAQDVRTALANAGLPAPQEIIELYGWRDGTRGGPGTKLDDSHFFPGFFFVPLSESLQMYEVFRSDERWDRRWLPIFANGGGDFYAAQCDQGANTCPVVGFILGYPSHPVEFETITSMASTLVAAFEQRVVYVEDGYLEMNDHAFARVARNHNPGVASWRDASSGPDHHRS